MSFRKFYSLDGLIKEGKKLAKDCSTITFDLFDTLLIRRIHDPDLVKLPVARFISALASSSGINISWERVQKIRNQTEARQRENTAETFVDHEACYPIFMEQTLKSVFKEKYEEELLQVVTNFELEMENSMLVPRKKLVSWLVDLTRQNKKIYILSDIYLPADHLKTLVEHAGLLQYVQGVISSADTFLAKASGKAFELVEEQFNLEKNSWLHIGDNPISDGLRASEFGIKALVLHDAEEKRRKAVIKRYYQFSETRPFWRGRTLQQLMAPHEAENIEHNAMYCEGYNFLAPLIGGFVQHIAEQAQHLGLTKIFFLSREGYTFKKFWDKCIPTLFPEGGLPETHYLYVSRMALAGSSCAHQGLTKINADVAFLPAGNRDFRDVCRIFSLSPDKFEPFLTRHKLKVDTCLGHTHEGFDPIDRLRFYEMLEDEDFQEEVKSQTHDQNLALQRYLEDVGFFDHKRVAIVDIGWLGTIQRFFYEAVQHREDCPRFFGFLFAATRGIPFPTSAKNDVEGVIYDKHRFEMASSSLLYARDLFEEACRAPHPTLNGYRLTDEGYELEFRQTDDEIGRAELEQDSHFGPLQQGIIDGAKPYGAASALLGYSLEDYRPWFNHLLINKLAFPKTKEIKTIRHKHHLDDFHGKQAPVSKASGPKRLWEYSSAHLNFNPLLRTRLFWKHIKERISE